MRVRSERRRSVHWGLASLILLAAAGCGEGDKAREKRPPADAAGFETKPVPRSVMRPAIVTPEPAAPAPKPAMLVIPFGKPGMALDEAQRALLDPLAARLAGTEDSLILRGNTDSHGGDRRNRLVSLRRARLVEAYLAGKGIAKDRMHLVALGEDRPIAPNAKPDGSDDPDSRARNRRVEIEVVPVVQGASPAPERHPAP